MIFGVGLIGIFFTRFLIEFIKTEQEAFEKGMTLDMGQWLSIPFILLGSYMLVKALRQAPKVEQEGVKPSPRPLSPRKATPKK